MPHLAERASRAYYEDRRLQAAAVGPGPLGYPGAALATVIEGLHERGLQFRVVLREDFDSATEQMLRELGFEVTDRNPELALEC